MIRDNHEEAAELSAWMEDWRSPDPGDTPVEAPHRLATAAILRQVKRRSLGLKLLTAGEVTFVTGVVIALTLFALRHPNPFDVAAMASLCLLAVGAVVFSFWNRRGLWRPVAETTAAYLALALQRARRRQEGLRAARWLLAAETVIFIPWIWHTLHSAGTWHPGMLHVVLAYGYLALVVGVAAASLHWLERLTRRELAAFSEFHEGDA